MVRDVWWFANGKYSFVFVNDWDGDVLRIDYGTFL